jgi:methionyl-tRNA synthetase
MSDNTSRRILVTSALPYANGPIHLGHLAGAYLPGDLFCRYQRLKGEDVLYICGSDEMGVAIMVRARSEGVDPQEIVDRYHPGIVKAFEEFGMTFDYYGRTTSGVHKETSQAFFAELASNDVFKLRTEEQLFDPEAGIFLADRFVIGTCPNCGFENAYGDQCERCGTALSPSELINPRSTLTDATPEFRSTTHWYLPLGDFQDRLSTWISTRKGWKPNVLGQVNSWLNDGLRDRAITRDVPWGVPVPEEAARAAGVDAAGKVIYVWFDAPIGYISASREWALREGKEDAWKAYWQDESTRLVHFIGKDNIVFHCLMFPAMLMAHGGYVLPENVPANEFLNLESQKLSTSRGWAVWLHEYLEEFPADMLRYALASNLPETKDSDFSWSDFQNRVNSELADVLGNFINRTMTFATRFFDGVVPELIDPSEEDLAVLKELRDAPALIGASYDQYRNREAVFSTISLARTGNKFFNDTEPWHTRKDELQKCANTIHVCLQICGSLSILMDPVLPGAASSLRRMLKLSGLRTSTASKNISGDTSELGWDDASRPLLQAGHKLGESQILFHKVEDEQVQKQVEKLKERAANMDVQEDSQTEAQEEAPFPALADEIVYDDFAKLDLRAGTVTVAEPVKGSKKLLRLEIDLGFETRQILAGAAQHYSAEEMLGKKVVIVANLAPRKMMGLESQGMVLMAEDREGKLFPIASTAENGSVVR